MARGKEGGDRAERHLGWGGVEILALGFRTPERWRMGGGGVVFIEEG